MAAESLKKRAGAAEKAKGETPAEKVTLRNLCPHPVFFRIPGKSIRIGPKEMCDIETSLLSTPELSRLCRNRHVTVIKKREAAEKATVDKGKKKGK